MILVIDHYDSFVYNLVQLVESLGYETLVVRSDEKPVVTKVGACHEAKLKITENVARRRVDRLRLSFDSDVATDTGDDEIWQQLEMNLAVRKAGIVLDLGKSKGAPKEQ